MATTTITQVLDDIDGTPDAATITFGFQDVTYSIDLAQHNAEKLLRALEPFVSQATRVRTNGHKSNGNGKATRPYDLAALRAWAEANMLELPSRGRMPGAIVEAYRLAGGV